MAETSVVFEIAKLVATLTGGGLAGAVLTQWRGNRPRKRLTVNKKTIDYRLPREQGTSLGELKVFYAGQAHEALVYHELNVRNVGKEPVPDNPFLVTLPSQGTLLKTEAFTLPENAPVAMDQEGIARNQYRFRFGRLLPGDVLVLRMLVAGPPTLDWRYRGEATIEKVRRRPSIQMPLMLLILLLLGYASGNIAAMFPGGYITDFSVPPTTTLLTALILGVIGGAAVGGFWQLFEIKRRR